MNAANTGLYDAAIERLHRKAGMLELDPEILRILSSTANEIVVNLPVRMDDGRVEMFTGMRVQHNNVLGHFIGGLRIHPYVSIDETKALAMWTTLKASLLELPFGGAHGGIQMNPHEHSPKEIERIARRFTYALGSNIGPEYDIMYPDVNATPQIMAWILDTYLSTLPPHERARSMHVVTGKPVELGGCPVRDRAAGLSIVFAIEKWAQENAFALKGASYILQGFGSVGSSAALTLKEKGVKLVAVEDSSGPVCNSDGIDPEDLSEYVSEHGKIAGYPKAQRITHAEFMGAEADIFIPATLQNQITAKTAPLLKVTLVAEGADASTDAEGDAILQNKGIDVIPALICNSGGMIVSYFEMLQNKRSEYWEVDDVIAKLRKKVGEAYDAVSQMARHIKTDLRTAAYIVSLTHIEKVYKDRGIFP
jgi:glutamate dehydrogenase (NAD(P)+)